LQLSGNSLGLPVSIILGLSKQQAIRLAYYLSKSCHGFFSFRF